MCFVLSFYKSYVDIISTGAFVISFLSRKWLLSPSPHRYTSFVFSGWSKSQQFSFSWHKSYEGLLQMKVNICLSTRLAVALESPTWAMCYKVSFYQLLSPSAKSMIMLEAFLNGFEKCTSHLNKQVIISRVPNQWITVQDKRQKKTDKNQIWSFHGHMY